MTTRWVGVCVRARLCVCLILFYSRPDGKHRDIHTHTQRWRKKRIIKFDRAFATMNEFDWMLKNGKPASQSAMNLKKEGQPKPPIFLSMNQPQRLDDRAVRFELFPLHIFQQLPTAGVQSI